MMVTVELLPFAGECSMLHDFHNYLSSTAPYLLDLPMPVFTGLCVSLDSGAIHNWKALVHHLHDYMMTDICASSALLSRG